MHVDLGLTSARARAPIWVLDAGGWYARQRISTRASHAPREDYCASLIPSVPPCSARSVTRRPKIVDSSQGWWKTPAQHAREREFPEIGQGGWSTSHAPVAGRRRGFLPSAWCSVPTPRGARNSCWTERHAEHERPAGDMGVDREAHERRVRPRFRHVDPPVWPAARPADLSRLTAALGRQIGSLVRRLVESVRQSGVLVIMACRGGLHRR